MMNIRSSYRSFLSLLALTMGATLLIGGEARAATTSMVVPIAGTVTDATGSVSLSGQATIESTLVRDEFGGAPSVILSIHFSNVTGAGIRGSGEAVLIRPLASSDKVEVELSLSTASGAASAHTAMARFALSFDPVSGALVRGTGGIASAL
jgi:hypothetical protein